MSYISVLIGNKDVEMVFGVSLVDTLQKMKLGSVFDYMF